MLNREKHQLIMGRILRGIYSDTSLAPILGLKGGTCAYFFYDLPRFSVDLDFDLLSALSPDEQKKLLDKIIAILKQHGKIKDEWIKNSTILAHLSYGDKDHNVKIEISTRTLLPDLKDQYTLKEYLGISMFAGKKEYLFSSKLVALTSRKETAMRDVYDIHYFAKNNWDLDKGIIELWTGKKFFDYMSDCINFVENIQDNYLLTGLGELVNDKEKLWIKQSLKKEVIFHLKNYQASLSR